MATVAHTIYSRYEPKLRETLQRETGHIQDEENEEDPWQTTPQRRAAPRFVPATASYEWDAESRLRPSHDEMKTLQGRDDLAEWYRSLTSRRAGSGEQSVAPDSSSSDAGLLRSRVQRKTEKRNRNNWFIMNALQSVPFCASNIPPPTLADILARDPPPLPAEDKYSPPVWLALGPSNKGFNMLQQSGWNEGEPLGPGVVRRERVTHVIRDGDGALFKENSRTDNQFTIKQEERPVRGRNGEVSEVQNVIDLTLSDSDSDSGSEEYHRSMSDPVATITRPDVTTEPSPSPLSPTSVPISAYDRKALLTPIATVLKSDRLGIGLKAKTVGPYKASQKRVTHNAAALAAHIRNAEEQRKKRMEVGRGRGGFEKLNKREETKRKRMLAYLNE